MDAFGVMVFAEGTSYLALTDSEGRYTISGLPPGIWTIRAMRQDLESVQVETVTLLAEDLQRPQPVKTLLRVLMQPKDATSVAGVQSALSTLASLEGRVTTPAATGAAGALVRLSGTEFRSFADDLGSFTLSNIPPGKYELSVFLQGHSEQTMPVEVKAGERVTLRTLQLTPLDPELITRGRAQLLGGVRMIEADGSDGIDFSAVRVTVDGTDFSATVGEDGTFRFTQLPPLRLTIRAAAEGYALAAPITVDLTSGSAEPIMLALRADGAAEPERAVVFGRVILVNSEDSPEGARISIPGTPFSTTTTAEGDWTLEGPFDGTYRFIATLEGYKPASVDVAVTAGQEVTAPDLELVKDIEAPRVVFTNPAEGANGVPIDDPTVVLVEFSEKMDSASVTSALTISPEVGFRVLTEGSAVSGKETYRVELAGIAAGGVTPLRYATRYRLTISTGATSLRGAALEEDFDLTFTTGKAVLLRTFPEDGARDASLNDREPVRLFFNAPLDPDSISRDDVTFSPPLSTTPNISFRKDSRTGWTIISIQGFTEPNKLYRVSIKRGAQTITRDRVSNLPYRFSFKTRAVKSASGESTTGRNDPAREERRR